MYSLFETVPLIEEMKRDAVVSELVEMRLIFVEGCSGFRDVVKGPA